MGSGGAKGLAHIGILKVLRNNDIPVDLVAGSSMGSVIGGLYAAQQDVTEMEQVVEETDWQLLLSLVDPSLGQGLIKGEKIRDFIKKHLGDVNFKELKIPFSAVATDIKTGEAVALDQGSVVSAIRASISLPLIFKPVEYQDKLLTDGELSQPVPVKTVKEMGADIIIGVNLHTNDFEEGNLNSYQIANRSLDLLRYNLSRYNAEAADVVLNPEVEDIKWNDFLRSEEAIAAGEKEAQNKLPVIENLL